MTRRQPPAPHDTDAVILSSPAEREAENVIDFRAAARRFGATHLAVPHLSTLQPDWIQARHDDNLRPRGVEAYNEVFRRFVAFAGDIPANALDADLVRAYKRDMMSRVGAGTTSHALTVITAFCEWCVAEGHLSTNVARGVKHPRVEVANPDPLSREQIIALLAALDVPSRSYKSAWQRNRRAIALMLYAGLRLYETSGLERRDVDYDRREIVIRKEIAKGGKPRVVPMCDELLAELESVRGYRLGWAVVDQNEATGTKGQPLTFKSLAHLFERWLPNRIDFPLHAHQLRKTFATELYRRGEDILTIQRLLGHSDPKTTLRYIGASSEKEHAAVDKLTFRAELEDDEDDD